MDKKTLSPYPAPDNVSDIIQSDPVNLSTPSPYYGTITDAVARNQAIKTYTNVAAQKSVDEANARRAEADRLAVDQKKATGGFLSYLRRRDTTAATRSNAMEQIDFNAPRYFEEQKAQVTEIETLSKEYADLEAEKEEAINRIRDNNKGLFGSGLEDAEIARIERQYAPRLNRISANVNAKTALMEAQRGNYQDAVAFANQAVADATAEEKLVVDTYNLFYQTNQDQIARLDTQYKDALDYARNVANDEFDQKYKNAQLAIDRDLADAQIRKINAEVNPKPMVVGPGFENIQPEYQKLAKYLVEYATLIKDKNKLKIDPNLRSERKSILSDIAAEYKKAEQLGAYDAGVESLINQLVGDTGVGAFSFEAQTKAVNRKLNDLGYINPTGEQSAETMDASYEAYLKRIEELNK